MWKGDQNRLTPESSLSFIENVSGGAFVCAAHEDHRLFFVSDSLVSLFECKDLEDFFDFTGGTFEGMSRETSLSVIKKEVSLQIEVDHNMEGYVFYNIRTRKDHVRRVVNHWAMRKDPELGDVIYGMMYQHRFENTGSDFDSITGLYGKRKFRMQIASEVMNREGRTSPDFAIVYLNLVNFKLLNIDRGVAEGDACLKVMADILTDVFDNSVISRLSDDHFAVFTKYEKVMERTEEAERRFCESYGNRYNVIGKFGIYRFSLDSDFGIESSLSRAKVACDYIKYDTKTDIVEFSEELAEKVKTQEYVIGKIDEAIEKGWIKVYYQPVIRSLTRQLCSMESLVRWIDPEIGFLAPDQFISTLENERCIHKLDCYVVEQVCRCIHERMAARLPMVPVSVNFSRVDFQMCDMLEVVESIVEKYDIPRDYLHIEITESMIAADKELMEEIIKRFRKTGYEVWVDDFGSGYSSLTLLKDYRFDTLKMDMQFLADPFSEKSRSIMRSTVTMAKDIGMKTLAEGVETRKQFDFLREIGCGMIQGYYFGKPEPVEQVFAHMEEKGIQIEERKWRRFYETAASNVRVTDEPLEIVEFNGDNARNLFINRSYWEQIFVEKLDFDEIDRRLYQPGSPMMKKYLELADQAEKSGAPETFYYSAGGNFMRLNAVLLAKKENRRLFRCSIFNVTNDRNVSDRIRLESNLREINILFENVLMVNLEKNTVMPLLGRFQYIEAEDRSVNDLQESIRFIVEQSVFPTERKRCGDFLRSATLYDRVKASGQDYIEDLFRFRQSDGNYRWKEVFIILLPNSKGNEYIFCMKPYVDKMGDLNPREMDPEDKISETRIYANIWRSLVFSSDIKFYWKDKERRFLGASQSFLDYFGLDSADALIGKTDEELHWHVDNDQYIKREQEILDKGKRVIEDHGKCIVKGVVRDIVTSKIPLYVDNDIVGLAGYFVDGDESLARLKGIEQAMRTDDITGVMNSHAFVDAMIDFAEIYYERSADYGLILINNTRHHRVVESYGEAFANQVLRVAAQKIMDTAGSSCAVARPRGAVFAILAGIDAPGEIYELEKRLLTELNQINEVDGNSITVRIKTAAIARSESKVSDERMYELAFREVT